MWSNRAVRVSWYLHQVDQDVKVSDCKVPGEQLHTLALRKRAR